MSFTLEQINAIHDRLGSAETLAQYAQELHKIGVEHADSYVADGHSEYFAKDGHSIVSSPAHEKLAVSEASDKQGLLYYLDLHDAGKINYLEMSSSLAKSGIEKWVINTSKLTMTFYDKAGNELLVDDIK